MRKFRILVAIAMMAGMFACQNELEQEVTIPEVEKPDVYAENGYLVFKDHQAMDSVCKVLNEMPKVEFEAWEKSMGYRSARSLASKYATEYDKINSEQDWLRFKQNYGNDLKISDTDQMVDVQFPYESEAWSSVLNEDGLFKVGHSIIVCEEGKTISILDGDESKISLSRNLNVDDVDKRILVHNYKMNSMKSDPLDYTHGWLYDWPTYIDGKYGLETRLEYRQYTYLTGQPGQNTYRYDLVTDYYIWQKSTYKSWFGWIRKKTIFGIDDIEVYTNEAGYGANYSKLYTNDNSYYAYFCFLQFVNQVDVVGSDVPSSSNAQLTSSLKVAFKQYTEKLDDWIEQVEDDNNNTLYYCYPQSSLSWWQNTNYPNAPLVQPIIYYVLPN